MKLEELRDLIRDGRIHGAEFVLKEVVCHFEQQGFTLYEVIQALAAITGKKGYQRTENLLEDAANSIPNAYTKEKENDLDSII